MPNEESINQALLSASGAAAQAQESERSVQTEIMIQYGQTHRDIANLSTAVQKINPGFSENYVLLAILAVTPLLLLQACSDLLLVAAGPMVLALLAAIGMTGADVASPQFVSLFHFVVMAIGAPLCFLMVTIGNFYRLNFFAAGGPFKPTHIGISKAGLRFVWRNYCTFSTPVVPWSQIGSVQMLKKDRRGKSCNKLIVSPLIGRSLEIDLDLIRSERERSVLGNAFKTYLPRHPGTADGILALETQVPQRKRYTEIWTQSLLAGPKRARSGPLPPKTSLHSNKYQVVRLLGTGGQGSAYLVETAERSGLPRSLVLKEYVLPEQANMRDRRRALKKLEDEAQVLSVLSHSQIVRFYDMFVEDHRAYLAIEYVDGLSLRNLVKQKGPMRSSVVRALSLQMCDVLDYLHSREPAVVHQDFTPDNLICSSGGKLKLVDFNVARDAVSTRTGAIVGKQSYMSPEQFKGQVSASSDMYALAATLYFLLTGEDAEPLMPASSYPADLNVSKALAAIIERAMAFDPAERFVSIGSMSVALSNCHILDDELGGVAPEPFC